MQLFTNIYKTLVLSFLIFLWRSMQIRKMLNWWMVYYSFTFISVLFIWFLFPIIFHFYYFLYFFYSLYLWFPDDPFALGFFARFFSISDLTIPLIEILDWILYCVKQLSSTIVSLSPRLFSRSQCSLMDQNVFVFTFQCDLLIIYPPNLR